MAKYICGETIIEHRYGEGEYRDIMDVKVSIKADDKGTPAHAARRGRIIAAVEAILPLFRDAATPEDFFRAMDALRDKGSDR